MVAAVKLWRKFTHLTDRQLLQTVRDGRKEAMKPERRILQPSTNYKCLILIFGHYLMSQLAIQKTNLHGPP